MFYNDYAGKLHINLTKGLHVLNGEQVEGYLRFRKDGLGDIGSMDNYSTQTVIAKFIYAFDMFLGRVEIYPVLIVISLLFKRSR